MRRNRLGKERFGRGVATTSSPGLFLSKWEEREKALASAGHVFGANIPGNVAFAIRCFSCLFHFLREKPSRRGWSCEAVRRMECF